MPLIAVGVLKRFTVDEIKQAVSSTAQGAYCAKLRLT